MDEIINQQTDTIQSPSIQQEKPIKNKPSIWILFTIIFFITTLILSYLLLNQKQELNKDKEIIKEETKEEIVTGIIEKNDIISNEKIKEEAVCELEVMPTLVTQKINSTYSLHENKEFNIAFEYPTSWGVPKLFEGWVFSFDAISGSANSALMLAAVNPLGVPPARGAFWGDNGRDLKNEDDFKKLCPEENELCKTYKNKNGITIVKKYEIVDMSQAKANVYYIYNPNSIYSSIIVCDERIDRKIVPNAEKEIEDLVDSLRFLE